MSDNTQVQSGTGDSIRDIDRGGAGIKTQVIQLDFGGANTLPEQLVSIISALPVQEQGPAAVNLSLLNNILRELMITNYILKTGLNVPDDLDELRSDPYFNAPFFSPTD